MHFCSSPSNMESVYVFKALPWKTCGFPSKERGKKIILSHYECFLHHFSTEEAKDFGKHSILTQEYRIPRSDRSVNRRKAKVK